MSLTAPQCNPEDFTVHHHSDEMKANVFPSSINEAMCREDVRGNEDITPSVLTSALNADEWSVSHPGPLCLRVTVPVHIGYTIGVSQSPFRP
jgi:hypothetical protein